MWPMRASARQSVACRPNKLIGPQSEPNRPFFVGKQLPLPVSLCFTIITVSTSSTLATHRGQTSALTGTWTDSQTHLDNDFQYGFAHSSAHLDPEGSGLCGKTGVKNGRKMEQ